MHSKKADRLIPATVFEGAHLQSDHYKLINDPDCEERPDPGHTSFSAENDREFGCAMI